MQSTTRHLVNVSAAGFLLAGLLACAHAGAPNGSGEVSTQARAGTEGVRANAGLASDGASERARAARAMNLRLPTASDIAAREQTADQQVQQVLNRLAFGPRPGDAAEVRAMGVDRWIALQLEPTRIPDQATTDFVAQFKSLRMSGTELLDAYPPPGAALVKLAREKAAQNGGMMGDDNTTAGAQDPATKRKAAAASMVTAADSAKLRAGGRASYAFLGEIATSRVARAVMSERQLDEVLVDFWENHFNVFAGKDRTRYFLPAYDEQTIRPHAMGKFRDLLGAVAKSPAMLYYLDNWQSVADSGQPTLGNARGALVAQAARRRAIQQRLGNNGAGANAAAANGAAANGRVAQLVAAAKTRRRGLNENYARELMELHTLGVDGGYSQHDVTEVARALTGWTLSRGANGGEFVFRPQAHDAGAKTILGHTFAAGRGIEDGEQVLDMLASSPATARFISMKLARRFVSDSPPPALVARASETFLRSGGDIRETVRTIVTSPEFFATAAYRAKVKTPFELVTSALRVMGAAPDATPRTVQFVSRLGQPLFGHQAPDGYPDVGAAWMNTGAILNRINFGLAVAANRVPNIRIASWPASATLASLPREQQVDGVIREILGGAASTDTRDVLLSGTNPFLQARAGDTTGTVADGAAMSDGDGGMGDMGGMTDMVGPVQAGGTRKNGAPARRDRAANNPRARQQVSAGKEAVKPSAAATLTQSIGNLPPTTGLAQIIGLAIGAPEFQRR